MKKKGILVVLSGPAGSGKGTVVSSVFEKSKDFVYSVSATTRDPRPGEQDGVHYHFVTKEQFEELILNNSVLEYTNYVGNYYGTLKSAVEGKLEEGKNVILEIEVDGAMQVKTKFPDAVLVMVIPPDFKTLEYRLRNRGTNTEEDIKRRLLRACDELRFFNRYDYLIVNQDGEAGKAADEFIGIIEAEQHATNRNNEFTERFFNNK
ncbi:MAG: guanylate kinase [Clostridia bacterium]|nr:guanylate kinase [Clostridia bacterium]